MNRDFIIRFVLVGIVFLKVQQISADLTDFENDDDDLLNINKRQTWARFRTKHVFIGNPPNQHNDQFWDVLAQQRLIPLGIYGPNRPDQTFILVGNEADIMNNFTGQQHCQHNNGFKSTGKFYVVQQQWNANAGHYFVTNPNDQGQYHICAALEQPNNQGLPRPPVHYYGKE